MLFEFGQYTLHYRRWGQGSRVLLAFHGFGQDAGIWEQLEPSLLPHFTVYAFDHFHHGQSKYPAGLKKDTPLQPEFYTALFNAFLENNHITHYWLAGYSLGGKTALFLLRTLPLKPEGILLFAPDGITESGWYRFVSRTKTGEWLYRRTMNHSGLFFPALKTMQKAGLLAPALYKFVSGNLSSVEKRQLVLDTWRSYALLRGGTPETYRIIRERHIQAHIFTGIHDRVLHKNIGARFAQQSGATHHALKAGHDLLRHKTNAALKSLLDKLLLTEA
ncbi:MAG: alpha/beta fold hydrolase [Flavobacteriales bacterium]